MPWRNEGAVSEGVNNLPSTPGSVRYIARFHSFSYSSFNFSRQLRCFVERINRKRLSGSFIQFNSRLSVNGSCVSHHGQRICQTFLLQFRLLLYPRQLILKLTSDVQNWIALRASDSKTVTLFKSEDHDMLPRASV